MSMKDVVLSSGSLLSELNSRQGYNFDAEIAVSGVMKDWALSARVPSTAKTLNIYLYDPLTKVTRSSFLTLFINPTTIQIGGSYTASSAVTRHGTISTMWGQNLPTLTFDGSSAGFYYMGPNGVGGGLTNFNRKNTAAFVNYMALVSIFKNNGAYYLGGTGQNTIFRDYRSSVINVMDCVCLEYDGTQYVGTFNTFTISDTGDSPYRLKYQFEFIVSTADNEEINGHLRVGNNHQVTSPRTTLQGYSTDLTSIVTMSEDQLNTYFKFDPILQKEDNALSNGQSGNDDNLRSGGGAEYIKSKPVPKYNRVGNYNEYLAKASADPNSEDYGILQEIDRVAGTMGIKPEELKALINFESANTWNPGVRNSKSSAEGIGQWIDDAALEMAPYLKKHGLIPSNANIKTSSDMLQYFPNAKDQIKLFAVYTQVTSVGGKPSKKLQQVMDERTGDAKFDALMIGHFQPAAVNDPNALLPPNVRAANPNVNTGQQYTVRCRSNMQKAVEASQPPPVVASAAKVAAPIEIQWGVGTFKIPS